MKARAIMLVALVAGVAMSGCERRGEEKAAEPEEAPKKVEAKEPEPEPSVPAPQVVNAGVPESPLKEISPLARFRSQYLADRAITDDPELLAQIEKLKDAGKGKEVLAALKGNKDALPGLRKALWHPNANVRSNVAKILLLLDDHSRETTEALVESVLHDGDGDVRANVARVLVTYKEKDTVPALITVLESDPKTAARDNAAWALGQIGDRRAIQPLIEALNDRETWVRLRAVGALKRLKAKEAIPELVEVVGDSNSVVRERAVQTLQALTGKKIGEDVARWKAAVGKK